jgi:hypothetical protein
MEKWIMIFVDLSRYRLKSPGDLYGLNIPCFCLIKGSNKTGLLYDIERKINNELNLLNPFNSQTPIKDVVNSFGLGFWNFFYYPFISVLAPLDINFPKVKFDSNSIVIDIPCSHSIECHLLKGTIGGRNDQQSTNLKDIVTHFDRNNTSCYYNYQLKNDYPETTGAIIKLYYNDNEFEERYISRS